ncbi:MAG TPA: hypothetical protein VGN37_22860 [Actinocatenispora sp.]
MTNAVPGLDGVDPGLAALPDWPPAQSPDPAEQRPQTIGAPADAAPTPRVGTTVSAAVVSAEHVDQSTHHQTVHGTTINANVVYSSLPVEVAPPVRRVLVLWDEIHRAAMAAVSTEGIAGAAETLGAERVLLLGADPGEGASTARLCIAHHLATQVVAYEPPVERLALDDDEETLEDAVRDWNSGRLVLVDAIGMPDDQRVRLIEDIAAVKATVDATSSFLLVTVPRRDLATARTRYPNWTASLPKPDGVGVFQRKLSDTVDRGLAAELIADGWFRNELHAAWPAHAAHLASLVATSAAHGTASVDRIREEVRSALADWTTQLRSEIDGDHDARSRSLLIATALVEGATPGAITAMAESLVTHSGYSLDEPLPHPMIDCSVVTRLKRLGHVDATPGSVTFTRPEFGRAVLPHVWVEHPRLQQALQNWVIDMPTESSLRSDDLAQAVDRVVELVVRNGPHLAGAFGRGWIAVRADSLATRLLTATATDPRIGRDVRRMLWNWSKSAPRDVQRVVAIVCAGEYGEVFPANALTRLKHLADSEDDAVQRAVVEAVTKIAKNLGPDRLLGYLHDWLTRLSPRQAEALARALRSALADDDVRAQLTIAEPTLQGTRERSAIQFWRTALDVLPYERSAEVIGSWIDAANSRGAAEGDFLIDQLIRAVGTSQRRMVHLAWATSGQRYAGNAAERLMQRLLTRLDEPFISARTEELS